MEKISNWEEVEVKGISDFKSLEAGAYKCKIIKAEEYTGQSGNTTLKVAVDIVNGEFKDYFTNKYKNDDRTDKKWDNNACKYLGLGESGLPFFKGFITCIENSNPGYKWNWNEESLKDKYIGCVFSYEEYEKQDGTKGVKVRLSQFRSIDKLGEVPIQDRIKLLNGTYMSIDDYYERSEESKDNNLFEDFGDTVEITDDILD